MMGVRVLANCSAALLLVALFGCQNGQSSSTETSTGPQQKANKTDLSTVNGKSLLPLKPGSKWVFSQTESRASVSGPPQNKETDMTFEVVSATETARGTEAKLLVRSGDAVANPMTWLVNDKGIFQLSATVGDTKGGKLE